MGVNVRVNVADGVGVLVIVGVMVIDEVNVGVSVRVEVGSGVIEGVGSTVSVRDGTVFTSDTLIEPSSRVTDEQAIRKSKLKTITVSKCLFRKFVLPNSKRLPPHIIKGISRFDISWASLYNRG